jgi:triacylglycerol lipase
MIRRIFTALALSIFLATPLLASGGGSSSKPLAGSYPIVLVHGILGFNDSTGMLGGAVKYWGGISQYLRDQGVPVLTPGTNPMDHSIDRANGTAYQVNQWMAANGYSKVHLIGHSQGGPVTRYMYNNISSIKNKIATVSTVNGVNHGTPIADIGLAVIPDFLEPFVATIVNTFASIIYVAGGHPSSQDVIAMTQSLSISYIKGTFNPANPKTYKVYSYGSKMAWADLIQHPLMGLTYPATWAGGLFYSGVSADNDGVVPLSAQKWGTWKGSPSTSWWVTGLDHLQMTTLSLLGVVNGNFDAEGYYLSMAQNAMNNQ